ncbi:MAG: AAA family ATPase [Bacteroidales bacterium]|nr:AAA family ATPase [Bacteroidales bacterium]
MTIVEIISWIIFTPIILLAVYYCIMLFFSIFKGEDTPIASDNEPISITIKITSPDEENQSSSHKSNLLSDNSKDIPEEYFNDIRDTALKLLRFGKQLSANEEFCTFVGESIHGSINWNGQVLEKPKDKIPVYLFADVIHGYQGLDHGFRIDSAEGMGLLIFCTLMADPDIKLEYQKRDLLKEKMTDSVEKFINEITPAMSGNENLFLLEVCLKEFDKDLHEQYVVLLYRFVSLIAKVDNHLSSTESKWLDSIIGLKSGGSTDVNVNPSYGDSTSSASEKLHNLIGLSSVKSEIDTLTNYIRIQKLREEKGMKISPISYHCVFTGNPGTGKTTVARILSEAYKELGIMKKGHLVETDRSGLVAEYVGQTAVKTNKIIDSALDGVLFIDEAYTLTNGDDNDYGKEAIATLLKRMEDDRDRLAVILAGYSDDMKTFIDSNPGLRSRFNRFIEFPDYTEEELYRIFETNAAKYEYTLTEQASATLKEAISMAVKNKDKFFGNARFARNLFEKIIEAQANRLSSFPSISAKSLATIEEEDVQKVLYDN